MVWTAVMDHDELWLQDSSFVAQLNERRHWVLSCNGVRQVQRQTRLCCEDLRSIRLADASENFPPNLTAKAFTVGGKAAAKSLAELIVLYCSPREHCSPMPTSFRSYS